MKTTHLIPLIQSNSIFYFNIILTLYVDINNLDIINNFQDFKYKTTKVQKVFGFIISALNSLVINPLNTKLSRGRI